MPRPPTIAELLASVIERVGRLTADELDRMALAEPAPIAFLATLRQVVPPELERQLDAAERSAMANLPPAARRSVPIRDAVVGRLADILFADVLEEILGDPASIRARERLSRGWDSAVGQPRYGPATTAVATLIERLRGLDDDRLRRLASTGTLERLGASPWPQATSPEEDDALRVSSELAGADAVAAVDTALKVRRLTAPRTVAAARRAAARIAHLLVLRHAFPIRSFDRHAAPWLGDLIDRPAPWGGGIRGR
jgi:hypothetical protein